jgi:hypothetical protein
MVGFLATVGAVLTLCGAGYGFDTTKGACLATLGAIYTCASAIVAAIKDTRP